MTRSLKYNKYVNIDIEDAPEKIDYVLVRTGYVSRLLGEDYKEMFSEIVEKEKAKCIYLYDDVWGEGLYIMNKNDKNKVEEMRKVWNSKRYPYDAGCLCLETSNIRDVFSFIKKLMEIEYCAFFDMENLDDICVFENGSICVLKISFNTESG